ncbi:N-acetyl-gamma-glutamyl-phosphate reductase [Balneolaceae bacterium ANBcel3]|nr:N-acetyl-gamma-glutamyl-phosphate reductase [Balneolaceae bacterium ANBcel3]
MKDHFSVSVVGASGYTGMETIRILHGHPNVTIDRLYGGKSAGTAFSEHYKALESLVDLPILGFDELKNDASDAVFLGLPHGKSAEAASILLDAGYKGKIIDISSDFRLKKPEDYEKWYNWKHPDPKRIEQFVYGLTEWYRGDIRRGTHISNPGCFATAMQLGILPFVKAGLADQFEVMGMTGSSGSGASSSAGTHYSSRFGNVKAYKVYKHQHIGEVSQSLKHHAPEGMKDPVIRFTPVSGPFVRGIWMTIAFTLNEEAHAVRLLEEEYYNAPLVRLRDSLPELKHVAGSAFSDIGCVQEGRSVIVGVAIDNLLKGAASQAVQNFNLLMDLPEETGLLFPPSVL